MPNLSGLALLAMLAVAALPALAQTPAAAGSCQEVLVAYRDIAPGRPGNVAFLGGGNDTARLGFRAGGSQRYFVDGGPDRDKLFLRASEQIFLDMLHSGKLAELESYFRAQAVREDCTILDLNPAVPLVLTSFEDLELHVMIGTSGANLTRYLPEILAIDQPIQNLVFPGELPTSKADLIFDTEGAPVAPRRIGPDDVLIPVTMLLILGEEPANAG